MDNAPYLNSYLPPSGEGDTMASQIATAVCKIIYRWYNDGDVYDNVHSGMQGWGNDLSSYANWLYTYVPEVRNVLKQVYDCYDDKEYEYILQELQDTTDDLTLLTSYEEKPKVGSVYSDYDGPFAFEEYSDDEDEDDYYGW